MILPTGTPSSYFYILLPHLTSFALGGEYKNSYKEYLSQILLVAIFLFSSLTSLCSVREENKKIATRSI